MKNFHDNISFASTGQVVKIQAVSGKTLQLAEVEVYYEPGIQLGLFFKHLDCILVN